MFLQKHCSLYSWVPLHSLKKEVKLPPVFCRSAYWIRPLLAPTLVYLNKWMRFTIRLAMLRLLWDAELLFLIFLLRKSLTLSLPFDNSTLNMFPQGVWMPHAYIHTYWISCSLFFGNWFLTSAFLNSSRQKYPSLSSLKCVQSYYNNNNNNNKKVQMLTTNITNIYR